MKTTTTLLIIFLLASCDANTDVPPGYLPLDNKGVTVPEKYSRSWPIEAWGEVDGERFELDETGRVLEQLKTEGIKYKLVPYYNTEFLVWDEKDNACVQKILINHPCN